MQRVLVGTDPLADMTAPNSKSLLYGTFAARSKTLRRFGRLGIVGRFTIDAYNLDIGLASVMDNHKGKTRGLVLPFAPHLAPGQGSYLSHEVWRLVQQRQGRVQHTLDVGGTPVNDNPGLEHEVDVMGAKALQRAREPR